MCTLPPLMTTLPPALVVTLVKAVVPPTAPPKVVTPEVFTTKACAPLSVLPNVIAPLPVLVSVVSAPKDAASPKLCAPVVLTKPPLMATVPPASVLRLVNAVVPPTAPVKVVAPEVLTAKV